MWRKPPSDPEQARASAVREAITKAVKASEAIDSWHPRFVLHGSYGNNTNVRQNSDVDVAVVLKDLCIANYEQAPGLNDQMMGLAPKNYSLAQLRADAEGALRNHFGTTRVQSKNKAIHIKETGSHLEADVIACVEYRRYRPDGKYHSGICFQTLDGKQIHGWPDQNLANGNAKTEATGRRYKRVVRILKRLTYEMADAGKPAPRAMPGCLIEALCYNLPIATYGHASYREDVREVVRKIYLDVKEGRAKEWVEVNDLQYLFHAGQKWNQDIVVAWAIEAWNYAELA